MHTAAERPDLWERGIESADVWPEYNLHGDVLNQWWGLLDEELPELQFVLHDDETDTVVAEGHTGAFVWDGDDATLPRRDRPGASRRSSATAGRAPPVNTLCALAAESPRDGRRRGLAVEILGAMRTIAERHGLAPPGRPGAAVLEGALPRHPDRGVRPLAPPRRQLLDPWMRVHERLGARVSTPLPESLLITGSVLEWESWTGLPLPASGDFVFPEGLAPLHVDLDADRATYWEPNVWMVHPDIEGGDR